MNTNDPAEAGIPQGWPDVATIERLANQFFQAPPTAPPPIPSTDSLDPLTPLGGTMAPVVAFPGEGELRELLAQFAPAGEAVPQPAAVPYYFLEYATPEFPSPGVVPSPTGREPLDVLQIRRDFPILQERVNGRPLIWLDNAATTQKPQSVIDRLKYFYEHENSNIHRAAHELAARATDAYEQAREKVRGFLNASSAKEIVFVRGATEAINLVAQSWGRQHIGPDDEILITWLEHHANIVPWQQLATEKGARLKVVPVDDSGQVLMDAYGKLLGPRTKLVSFTQVSNALGVVTPAKQIIEGARSFGAKVLLDGAQAVSHMRIDLQDLNPDWYVFSGHKVFAPTGIGVLYGKEELLNEMQPWQGGGNMIKDVTFERTTYQPAPLRFEAGTGNIGDAVGLGAAIDYLDRVGMERISEHEHQLILYATRLLNEIPGLRLIGTAPDKAGVLSFVMDGHRTEDIGSALNQEGIAVRAGHHCAQPILRRFGVESTVRPSFALYNSCADIDALVAALARLAGGRNPSFTSDGRSAR
jgi:cysteine desulfurase/selenocysteine lyase